MAASFGGAVPILLRLVSLRFLQVVIEHFLVQDFNPIQDGGKKPLTLTHTSFSPAYSTKVGIRRQKRLLFSEMQVTRKILIHFY